MGTRTDDRSFSSFVHQRTSMRKMIIPSQETRCFIHADQVTARLSIVLRTVI